MASIDSTVTIARPVPEVFDYFLELDRYAPETDPRLTWVVKDPAGPTGPGTTFRFRQHLFGKPRDTQTRFTSIETNRRITFEAEVGPLRPKGTFSFEAADGGTRLSVRIDDTDPVRPFKPLAPLFARVGQRVWDDRLRRIRAVLEGSTRTTPVHPVAGQE